MMLAMTAMAYAQTDTMKGADDMAQQAENQMAKKPMMQDDMAKKEMKDDMKGHDTMHKDGTVEWRFKDGTVAITHPTGPLAGVEMPNPPPPPAEPQRTTPKFRQTFSQRHIKRIRRQAS